MRARLLSGTVTPSALVLTLVATACSGGPPTEAPAGSPTIEEMASDLGADVVEHLRRGYVPEMSPDIAYVPKPFGVVVRFSGKRLGTLEADPRSSHSTPWDYHQRVPIILYGPGFVREGAVLDRSVDVADLAPTFAELLGADFPSPDGEPLSEALLPEEERPAAPKVIALVAHDGGGWNLLERWPEAWPAQRRLADQGTTYVNATIGSAPSVTTAIHANMGTGAYPERHGLSEINGRLPDGTVGETYLDVGDPRLLQLPTLGDVWDAANGNEPWVGILGYESWHLGMMSHGGQTEGLDLPGPADRDLGVLWEPGDEDPGELWVNEDFYALPDYLPGPEVLDGRLRELDAEDGALDGRWFDNDLADPKIVPGTPAFIRYQQDALLEMIEREPIGDDDLADLLFVELKPTDFGGHIWNMVAPEEEFVLRAQDDVVGALVDALDEKVGRGNYVLAITADHGQTPIPETTGGLRIHPDVLARRAEEYFGASIVEKVTPSGLFLDGEAMSEQGITSEAVARFVADLRYRDVLPDDADIGAIPEDLLEERVFAAALPGEYLGGLSAQDVESLGEGAYPEGDLSSPDGASRYLPLLG